MINLLTEKRFFKGVWKPDNIIIFSNEQNRFVTTPVDSGKWELPNLPAGKYKIQLYYDEDGNGKYSYGDAFPFKYSEPFIYMKNEADIPSRWTVEVTLTPPERLPLEK